MNARVKQKLNQINIEIDLLKEKLEDYDDLESVMDLDYVESLLKETEKILETEKCNCYTVEQPREEGSE